MFVAIQHSAPGPMSWSQPEVKATFGPFNDSDEANAWALTYDEDFDEKLWWFGEVEFVDLERLLDETADVQKAESALRDTADKAIADIYELIHEYMEDVQSAAATLHFIRTRVEKEYGHIV